MAGREWLGFQGGGQGHILKLGAGRAEVTPRRKGEAIWEDLGFSAPSRLPPWLSECPPGEEESNNHLAGDISVDG